MRLKLTQERALQLRMQSQRLHPRTDAGVAQLVRDLGVQAQDLAAATLALRARSHGLIADDIRHALESEHSIVRTWAMRGTMHLVAAEDVGWLLGLLGPLFIAKSAWRYRQLGLDEEVRTAATGIIRRVLATSGPQTRAELAAALAAKGIPVEGQAIAHLVGHAALQGVICSGPRRGATSTYVLLEDWIPPGPALDTEQSVAELALRYIGAYGPATAGDLARWSGLPMAQALAGLHSIADRLEEVEVEGAPAWMLPHREAPPDAPVVRLLPSYDTYLLGYRSREPIVASAYASRVHLGGGQIKPTLLVDGRLAGVWRSARRRQRLTLTLEPFEPLDDHLLPAIRDEAHDVGRFLGTPAEFAMARPMSDS